MSKTKEQARADLTNLLQQHLSPESYAVAPAHPKNGNLPLDVAYVRVEPWLYGQKAFLSSEPWDLCVETALQYSKVPVLALPEGSRWTFRVPLYLVNALLEDAAPVADQHLFQNTAELNIKFFSRALEMYQGERDGRDERQQYVDALSVVLGQAL